MIPRWTARWIKTAKHFSTFSEDMSTQVGAVIVDQDNTLIAQGWNGLPRGIKSLPERHQRPEKYFWFEHAERNAIFNAARKGHSTQGCTMYIYGLPPCHECVRAMIQAGIAQVVYFLKPGISRRNAAWAESCAVGRVMVQDCPDIYMWEFAHEDPQEAEAKDESGDPPQGGLSR